ncbi:heat-inducible transcription repressor HrcA [Desulforamulus reducens MI-1]|uniref:Heat-inducible transcription repressor HrcA n=1 Tax=Desulforamulus reducens (strain ATCC BAA-1160 / DSM 100696 / MI-1) TaxID=349161 RepID=HRCA_DESRM|nr:heat-inducible transcriptional repressor HrcA [Desulforamulus reducens]A4J7F6.1 RecName: Full=Heat-inducible transcription repressor HrcA [Desulforamulus reducens MI-1]ABO51009.1 heat-inducible transcription repressor HrcA [Desulforamulus reducens MI-1]
MKMDERKQQILLAIIKDYINTAEPVGSRTISRKYKLGVSPATIRNEMSDLEEMGYIEQPHTSAGRIPSNLGYRYYVDCLMQREQLSEEEEVTIRRGYENKVREVGEVLNRTGRMMAQLTHYTALVQMPSFRRSAYKHVQMVLMGPSQAILIVVMDTGAVHHQMMTVPESITQQDLDQISSVLNAKLQGRTMDNIRLTLIKEIYFELSKHRSILDLALELMQDRVISVAEDKIYLEGVFNILNQPEFHNVERVKILLSLLEQEDTLKDILDFTRDRQGITIKIGNENLRQEIQDCSMVTATYQVGDKILGTIGVLGPTRMDYARVVTVIDCMSRNLSRTLDRILKGQV